VPSSKVGSSPFTSSTIIISLTALNLPITLLSAVLILREWSLSLIKIYFERGRLSDELTEDLDTGLRGVSWAEERDLRRIIEYFYYCLENLRS